MARGHGRILTSIWEDPDFLALDEREQRLYLFLISQPNLNHAGLLDLTLRRWSRKARGLTVAELEKRITALDEARFIAVDDDTEELLIRSFVRNDGVWRMPKVMGAMVSGALEISSKRLQRALLAEMDRIPLEELSDEPTKLRNGTEGPSNRQQVADHIETLRKAFRTPEPDPTEGGSVTPSGPPSGTPSDPPVHGGIEGDPKGSTRGRAPTSRAHSPAPAPAPAPAPEEEGGRGGLIEPAPPAVASAPRPDGLAPIDIDGFTVTDTMRRWMVSTYPNLDPDYETEQFVSHFRAEGTRRRNWPEEWKKWIRRANKWDSERRSGGNVRQFPASRPSTTDARVAQGLALAAKYREQEQQAALEAGHTPPQESA
ncbi:hypothetical protein [Streptomyces sp. 5-6(2022)]|uniref:hypothetical protein n=1 Tax=Streptomyces sp. 5-6(2022) TaxID=2936510 RepID=UPI0023B905B8|nr:hypothetical protein [Streptomyces sp. 5-6(2022)]